MNAFIGRLIAALCLTNAAATVTALEDYANPGVELLAAAEPIGVDRLATQYQAVPDNETWVHVRHMGDVGTEALIRQAASPIASDRSDKTGFLPPVPTLCLPAIGCLGGDLGQAQRGFEDDPVRGTNVYQVWRTTFGWHVNTFQFGHEEPIECPPGFEACAGGPNIAYGRTFSPGLDPWRTADSEFTMQTFMKLPFAHYEPVPGEPLPAAQVSFLYYLEHPPTGHLVAGLVNLFDTRPFDEVGFERSANDGITAFVSSDLRNTQPDGRPNRYLVRSPWSAPSRNRYAWRDENGEIREYFLRAHVSRDNLRNILDDTDSPGEPAEYRVLAALILIEAAPRVTGEVSFAGSFRDFSLYRFYDLDD